MDDLINTVEVPVPRNREFYITQAVRMAKEFSKPAREDPPVRLAGCFGFSPCAFRNACHGDNTPEMLGFVEREKGEPPGDSPAA
jgi:hypothetical protein